MSLENSRLSPSVIDAHLERVEPPPALVAFEHRGRADVEAEAIRLDDGLGQRRNVAEAEIEALAGDRVDAVGGIADQRQALGDEGARQRQAERKGARVADGLIAPS